MLQKVIIDSFVASKVSAARRRSRKLCVQRYDFFLIQLFSMDRKSERLAKVRAFFSLFIDVYAREDKYKMLAYFKICFLFAK